MTNSMLSVCCWSLEPTLIRLDGFRLKEVGSLVHLLNWPFTSKMNIKTHCVLKFLMSSARHKKNSGNKKMLRVIALKKSKLMPWMHLIVHI